MGEVSRQLGDYILKRLSNYDLVLSSENREVDIHVAEDDFYNVMSFLQHDTHSQFDQLLDLIVLDQPHNNKRFQLFYIVRSLKNNCYIRIITHINAEIFSVAEIYKNALWLEREAWEMFGIFFKNNRDLRRLLTDDRLRGYPLRKEYPLCGFSDYVFDDQRDRFLSVLLNPNEVPEFFSIKSSWKGPLEIFPQAQSAGPDVLVPLEAATGSQNGEQDTE